MLGDESSTSALGREHTVASTTPSEHPSMALSPPFHLHQDGNIGPRWKKWNERFERLLVAMVMDITAPKRQRALLLHYAGLDVYEVYNTLTVPEPGEQETVYVTVKALTDYFTPRVNTAFDVYSFR